MRSHPLQQLKPRIPVGFAGLSGLGKILMVALAIANSSKLKTLDDRIALIDKRLGLSADSIDYGNSKLWTNYLPTSTSSSSVLDIINPLAWVKNLAGGGEVRSQLETFNQQQEILRIRYRLGEGDTSQLALAYLW